MVLQVWACVQGRALRPYIAVVLHSVRALCSKPQEFLPILKRLYGQLMVPKGYLEELRNQGAAEKADAAAKDEQVCRLACFVVHSAA